MFLFSIFPFNFFLYLFNLFLLWHTFYNCRLLKLLHRTVELYTHTHTHRLKDWTEIAAVSESPVLFDSTLSSHNCVEVLWGSVPLWNRGHTKVSSTPDHTWTWDWALLLTEFLWGFSANVFLRNGSALSLTSFKHLPHHFQMSLKYIAHF